MLKLNGISLVFEVDQIVFGEFALLNESNFLPFLFEHLSLFEEKRVRTSSWFADQTAHNAPLLACQLVQLQARKRLLQTQGKIVFRLEYHLVYVRIEQFTISPTFRFGQFEKVGQFPYYLFTVFRVRHFPVSNQVLIGFIYCST